MWQAGLLCLVVATTSGVVIHQPPLYQDTNQLHTPPYRPIPQPQQPLLGLQHTAPPPPHKADDYDDEPSYSFVYQIHDELTGDEKSHSESRQGDVVQGSYSLIEPDGSRRIVDYIADKVNGFRAQVRREPGAAKPIVAAKIPVAVYKPAQPAYIPRYSRPVEKYQNGPVTFSPARYLSYNTVQPAPVTEHSKYATVTLKPQPAGAYNPVVYASPSNQHERVRTAPPGSFTNPNQISYNPVQYA